MQKRRRLRLIALIVLDLLWVAFILLRSLKNDNQSNQESNFFLDLLLRVFPGIGEDLGLWVKVIRKLAHFTEFFLLGGLLWWTCRLAWRRMLWQPFAGGAVVACIDEMIQRFVPGRSGQLKDVAIDCAGVLTAVLLCWLLSRRRQRKQAEKASK